jgi:phosphoribosylformylglycinamidine cyclo-ligase
LPENYAQSVIDIAKSFHIEAQIIGHVQASMTPKVLLKTPFGEFDYV